MQTNKKIIKRMNAFDPEDIQKGLANMLPQPKGDQESKPQPQPLNEKVDEGPIGAMDTEAQPVNNECPELEEHGEEESDLEEEGKDEEIMLIVRCRARICRGIMAPKCYALAMEKLREGKQNTSKRNGN
jgi:hypothetical protein